MRRVLGMKHVRAEVEYRFLIYNSDAVLLSSLECNVIRVLDREPLNKVAYLVDKLTFLQHLGESLFAQVTK